MTTSSFNLDRKLSRGRERMQVAVLTTNGCTARSTWSSDLMEQERVRSPVPLQLVSDSTLLQVYCQRPREVSTCSSALIVHCGINRSSDVRPRVHSTSRWDHPPRSLPGSRSSSRAARARRTWSFDALWLGTRIPHNSLSMVSHDLLS